jgi:putative ABC transport system substrate-binding protein
MGPYRTALRDLGYIEGKNIQIETRSAGGQIGRLPELAAELVALHGDFDRLSLGSE